MPSAPHRPAPSAGPHPPLAVLQAITTTARRGAEVMATELHPQLVARGVDVCTVALEPASSGATVAVQALSSRRWSVAGLRSLRTLARSRDVVVAHGSATLTAAAFACAGGPPFVYRVIGDPLYWAADPLRRLRVRLLLERSAARVVYYPAAADALVRRYHLDPQRVHVIPKGVEVATTPVVSDEERAAARAQLDIPPGADVVVWMGALSPEKQPALAIEVAERLGGPWMLIIGDGPERRSIERRARASTAQVRVVGSLADPRVALAAADALVLTSRTEGVPGAVLEAAALGIPAVALDVGGVHAAIESGVTGMVVTPCPDGEPRRDAHALAMALRRVLDESAPMGRAARERVERCHDIGHVADQWITLLDRVVRG